MEIGSGSDGEMGAVGMQMSVSYHHHHHGTTSQQPAAAAAAAALEIGNSNNCNNNTNNSSNNNNNNNNNGAQAGNSEHGNGGAGEAAVVTAAAAGVGAGGVLRSSTAGLRSSSGGGSGNIKYRECLKNHAASIGGHANDGCGEFMPSGEEGSLEALKCAACGCHRNFHRRECGDLTSSHHPSCCYFCGPPGKRYGVPLGGPSPSPLALPAPAPRMMLPPESGEHGGGIAGPSVLYAPGGAKKRFRTKFTQEQKDKMCAFAEKLGWRIQKHDDLSVQQFCMEVGVKRHVLKVWMHNNKHTLAKKPS